MGVVGRTPACASSLTGAWVTSSSQAHLVSGTPSVHTTWAPGCRADTLRSISVLLALQYGTPTVPGDTLLFSLATSSSQGPKGRLEHAHPCAVSHGTLGPTCPPT